MKIVRGPDRVVTLKQSHTGAGLGVLAFAALGLLVFFARPEVLQGHTTLLLVLRIFFVGVLLLGVLLVGRRQETQFDPDAQTWTHRECSLIGCSAVSGAFGDVDALELRVSVNPGSASRNDAPKRSLQLDLVVKGERLPVFRTTERGVRPSGAEGAEETARRLASDTGLLLRTDQPPYYG